MGEAATTQLNAGPEQNLGSTADPTGELSHQSGLADAGLTSDEDRCWLPRRCRVQPSLQPSELRLAADEPGTGGPHHGSSIALAEGDEQTKRFQHGPLRPLSCPARPAPRCRPRNSQLPQALVTSNGAGIGRQQHLRELAWGR